MRGEPLTGRTPEENALLQRLDQRVEELGKFDVFWARAEPGRVTPEARGAAFEFAVEYGRCLHAGFELESDPYFPAEILSSVAHAAAVTFYEEFVELENLCRRVTMILTWDTRRERAEKIYNQFMRLAFAYKTIEIAFIQYRQLIQKVVPAGKGNFDPDNDPFVKESKKTVAAFKRARDLISSRGGWIQRHIPPMRWQAMEEFLSQN